MLGSNGPATTSPLVAGTLMVYVLNDPYGTVAVTFGAIVTFRADPFVFVNRRIVLPSFVNVSPDADVEEAPPMLAPLGPGRTTVISAILILSFFSCVFVSDYVLATWPLLSSVAEYPTASSYGYELSRFESSKVPEIVRPFGVLNSYFFTVLLKNTSSNAR